jgi:hypothetical protein
MSSYSDSDTSIDTYFNDGAEDIIGTNATFNSSDAPRAGEGEFHSRSSTPPSHKDCVGYAAHGQGAPVYSCGHYKYSEIGKFRYTQAEPLLPDLEVCANWYIGVLQFIIQLF